MCDGLGNLGESAEENEEERDAIKSRNGLKLSETQETDYLFNLVL